LEYQVNPLLLPPASVFWDVCRYLREYQALGTVGGLYLFRDAILKCNPKTIIVMHADVYCLFPLEDMLAMHLLGR
jgi:NDP-sugar pyrophosphorylase family protein